MQAYLERKQLFNAEEAQRVVAEFSRELDVAADAGQISPNQMLRSVFWAANSGRDCGIVRRTHSSHSDGKRRFVNRPGATTKW